MNILFKGIQSKCKIGVWDPGTINWRENNQIHQKLPPKSENDIFVINNWDTDSEIKPVY